MANIVEVGKLYRDGEIDAFQAQAMIESLVRKAGHVGSISDRRFQMFCYRWGVMEGNFAAARSGIWVMIQCERKLWNRHPIAMIPNAVCGEGC